MSALPSFSGVLSTLHPRDSAVHAYNYDGRLYTPLHTPLEDAAISGLVQRLRILSSPSSLSGHCSLILGEDPRFVAQLRALLDAAGLPFFSLVTDLSLYFEVSAAAARACGGAKKLVFGALRRYKPLNNFMVLTPTPTLFNPNPNPHIIR